jgi:hypothetical protein
MTRSKAILLFVGTLALCAAVAGFALGRGPRGERSAKAQRRPLACQLSVGDELGFDVQSTSEGRKPNAAPEQLRLSGAMWWRVLEERAASGWVVAVALRDVVLDRGAAGPASDRRAALEAPFLVHVGKDCSFRELAFDPTTQPETRKKLQGLLRAVEIILSPLPSAQWVSRHRDALGAFDATYKVDPARREDGVRITRKRTRYSSDSLPTLPAELGGRLRVDVVASAAHAVVDREGRWLREFEGSDQLRIKMGDRVMSDLTTSVRLSPAAGHEAPEALAELDVNRFVWGEASVAVAETDAAKPPPLDPALGALDLDGAIKDFGAWLGQGPGGLHQATGRLASYLAAHPKAIDDVLARLKRGDVDPKLHAPLFLALQKTGTTAAARALEGALADHGMSTDNRMRAAAALQDIARPSESTARALVDQAGAARGEGAEKAVSDASLLALGALEHRVAAAQPEVARIAKDYIGERLRTAGTPEDTATALDAIGNSGDTTFAKTLAGYADSPSTLVRAHAAQAYRGMDRETMEPALVDWLGHEDDAQVRRAIAESLGEKLRADGAQASPAIVAVASDRLASEPDAHVRAALIALLGSAAASDPPAKRALIEQFHRETVAELKALIGRFVTAEDLR